MCKRLIWAFLALASLLAVPALAGASPSGTPHTVKLTGFRDLLWSKSPARGVPIFPGATLMITGTVSGTIGGKATGQGAFYEKQTLLAHSFVKSRGHGAFLFPGGSISFTERTATNTPKSYVLKATVTGGTGAYQGASGKLTISGRAQHFKYDPDVSSNNVTGTMNF